MKIFSNIYDVKGLMEFSEVYATYTTAKRRELAYVMSRCNRLNLALEKISLQTNKKNFRTSCAWKPQRTHQTYVFPDTNGKLALVNSKPTLDNFDLE